jgi:hypothetical protein
VVSLLSFIDQLSLTNKRVGIQMKDIFIGFLLGVLTTLVIEIIINIRANIKNNR